jgi:hypothetical protein
MFTRSEKVLSVYAGVLTAALIAMGLTGARSGGPATFDTLDVQRINIREPDGTLRMVLASNGRFPGLIIAGEETPHERPQAGMLFFDDEGTENGGLIFAGKRKPDGKVNSGLSLTFDRYRQDQQLQLLGIDSNGRHFAGLRINDVLDGVEYPTLSDKITEELARKAIVNRLYVGKSLDGNPLLLLSDANGVPRINIMVDGKGEGTIRFMNAQGETVRVIKAEALADEGRAQ